MDGMLRSRLAELLIVGATGFLVAGAADDGGRRWKVEDFDAVISVGLEGYRDFENGLLAFSRASCAKCHRLGEAGEEEGADLAGVEEQLGPRDLLEAILDPRHLEAAAVEATSVDTLDEEDMLDLVAYVLSGGRAEHPFFQR